MAGSRKINFIGPLIVVLLIVGGCAKLADAVFGGDPAQAAGPITAPDLVNGTLLDAENKTEASGLRLTADGIASSYCPDETACVIYQMSPSAGTVLKAGAKVAVKFATDAEMAWYRRHQTMPDVVGWSQSRADRFFEPVQAAVDSESRESKKVPAGKDRVLAQSPKPGTALKVGQEIKLVIGYNLGSSATGAGGVGGVPNANVPNRRESRFCSRRWWC